MVIRAEVLQRAKKVSYKNPWEYTPNWETILDQLITLGSRNPPIPANGQATWDDLIDRLLTIREENNHSPGWVIRQIQSAGNPPIEYWQWLRDEFDYPFLWAERMWGKAEQTEIPDISKLSL
jgi:hypothetical protein